MATRTNADRSTPAQSGTEPGSTAPSSAMTEADTANGERRTLADDSPAGERPARTTVPVTFHRVAHGAESVTLAGDFNEWDASSYPLTRDGDVFAITVELEAGRRHRYRFVVDGRRWEGDPTAVLHEDNPFGDRDSVVDLSDRLPEQPVV